MSAALNITDIVVHGSEPTVHDLKLARALGYDQPYTIRKLIRRNAGELARYGELVTVVERISSTVDETAGDQFSTMENSSGKSGTSYYLNEPQAMLVAIRSGTERAADVRFALINMFLAWRRGELRPANDHFDLPELDFTLSPLAARVDAVRLATRLYGREQGRAMWARFGLPAPAALPGSEAHHHGHALMDRLMHHEIAGQPVRVLIEQALDGNDLARQSLLEFGIKLSETPEGFWLGSSVPGVKTLFGGDPDWLAIFKRLPGVQPAERTRFARFQSRAVWVALDVVS